MTHAIQICTYSSSDWHDWQEYTEWIFDISSDSFKDIVLNRIKEEYRPKNMPDELPDSLDNLNLTVAEAELYDYNMETGEHDLLREIEYADATLSITKKEIIIRSEGMFTTKKTFRLVEISDKTVFLPIQEFVCLPKRTPMVSRCYTEYFRDFEEAKKYYDEMPMKESYPFHFTKKSWAIQTEEEFKSNLWYRMNDAINKYPEADNFWLPSVIDQTRYIGKCIIINPGGSIDLEDDYIPQIEKVMNTSDLTDEEKNILSLLHEEEMIKRAL